MLFRLTIVFLLLFAFINNGSAQTLHFEHLTTVDTKLPSGTINSITQDKEGYLWFCTDNGLARYDGYNFYILKYKPGDPTSLSGSTITVLSIDSDGNLWIGTGRDGLNKYNIATNKITFFRKNAPKNQQLTNDSITAVLASKNKKVWIGTVQGLHCLDENTNTITSFKNDPNNPSSISNDRITSIFYDSKSNLWIGTDNGLNLFDEKTNKFKRYNTSKDSKTTNNIIGNISEHPNGSLWVHNSYSLSKYDEENDNFSQQFKLPPKAASNNNYICSISCSPSGIIWVATKTNGLLSFDPRTETFHEYDPSSNLSSSTIRTIFTDRLGILWVGTIDGGISKFDPLSNYFLTLKPEASEKTFLNPNNSVTAICEDSKGLLWVGTINGLYRYSNNQLLRKFQDNPKDTNGLPSSTISKIIRGTSDLIWISTIDGLRVYDVKLEKFVTNEMNLPDAIRNSLHPSILLDSKNILWVGSPNNNKGLYSYDLSTKTLVNYLKTPNSEGSISSNRIFNIYEDDVGNIWIATANGLNCYDREHKSFVVYQNDPKDSKTINNDEVHYICKSKFGPLWIATSKGLNKMDIETHSFSTIPNIALLNDLIYTILEDEQGNLWMSSNQGLIKYNPITNNIRNYTETDGLQDNEFNYWSCYKSPSGEFFFGGVNGFNRFYPDKIKDNKNIPKIVISKLDILDGRAQPIESKYYLPTNSELSFPYNKNFFYIEFSALNFTHPEKNKYAVKMEGVDKEWINCDSTKRFAKYPNLQPGEYIFHVIGSNNDGLWNNEGVSLKITIFPPWWRTNLAYFSYLLILGSLLFAGHSYRLGLLTVRNQELEKKVKERTEELNLKNKQLEGKNRELAENYEDLLQLNRKANRIFAALSEALPGTILDGKYRLEDKIGAGGFGAVYRAMHLNIKRLVAVKIFSPSPGNDSVENLERFQREAISTCRVNHPNAVAVLDSGISNEGIPYLVMELLQGHTLKTELKRNGKLTLKRCAEITIPICKVLAKAHASGLVHRDIKPDNIFLHYTAEGELVKVLDFGIAKLIDIAGNEQSNENLTKTGGIIGTPIYMAPERFALKDYDGRSDIYSLGIMLYEMLSGRLPFQDQAGSLATIMTAHLSQDPQPIKDFTPQIPNKIETIVLATLKKQVEERPSLEEIAKIFAEVTGIEYKASSNIEENLLKPQRETSSIDVDQTTVVIAPTKATPNTDQIDASEQITLQRTIE